jgi:endonuclease/exonuclease/phosphatase family metal-dependent hydrolase
VLIGPAPGDALHVMSFNLRFAEETGPNSWPARRPVLAELLATEQPTVIGTQEGLYGQLRDIAADLPVGYAWIGVGREGGSRGEFVAVCYDARRLEPVGFEHFWLSETPELIGSRSWDTGSVRMVTLVRFACKVTGTRFVVVNTHLDNSSELARVRGAELLRSRIPSGVPIVLTGDFNAPAQGSAVYDILIDGLTDTWTSGRHLTPRFGTFHGYRDLVVDGPRIDWILTRGATTVSAGINTFAHNGQFPSDHLPVQALIKIRAVSGASGPAPPR